MARKQLERTQRLEMESALRSLMTGYPTIADPELKKKVRAKVKKAMDEFDITPFPGYHSLPDYMKD